MELIPLIEAGGLEQRVAGFEQEADELSQLTLS